jgi:putative pyruvate formate lyase activating enzyme
LLHHWEEPCISGTLGSGTVFFSNCSLSCVYCQNFDISQQGNGKEISVERLAEIFIGLQNIKAHNINLVSPTHYVPQIIEALSISKKSGLTIPVVYNTNSYENVETVSLLNGLVQIYLPDLKYINDEISLKYSQAPNYFKHAISAIDEMFRQTGQVIMNNDGIAQRGVIIRHLLLPGLLDDSKKIMQFLYERFGDSVFFSIMNQYTPQHRANEFDELKSIRGLKKNYSELIDFCADIGITNAFIQEDGASSDKYIPDFNMKGV